MSLCEERELHFLSKFLSKRHALSETSWVSKTAVIWLWATSLRFYKTVLFLRSKSVERWSAGGQDTRQQHLVLHMAYQSLNSNTGGWWQHAHVATGGLLDEALGEIDKSVWALPNGYAQLTADDLSVLYCGSGRPGWSFQHVFHATVCAPRTHDAPVALLQHDMLFQSQAGKATGESPEARQAGQSSKVVKPRMQVASIHRFAPWLLPFWRTTFA